MEQLAYLAIGRPGGGVADGPPELEREEGDEVSVVVRGAPVHEQLGAGPLLHLRGHEGGLGAVPQTRGLRGGPRVDHLLDAHLRE